MRRGFQAKNLENNVRKSNNQDQSYQDKIFNRDTRYLEENKNKKIMLQHTFAPCTEDGSIPKTNFYGNSTEMLQIICE